LSEGTVIGVAPAPSASLARRRPRLLWAVLAPVLIALLGAALHSYFLGPIGLALWMLAVFAVFGLWIASLAKTAVAGVRRQWTAAGATLLAIAVSVPLSVATARLGPYVHLALSYPYYLYEIERTSERPVRFYWGDASVWAIDGGTIYTLVYDDSGKTESALGDKPVEGQLWIATTRLAGNFFLEVASMR
jgi:hypothetical protein